MSTVNEEDKTEFDFPDADKGDLRVEIADDKPEIEITDDTPAADRNRKPAEPPADPTDEELSTYSVRARKRIQHFTKGYHDERRAKETSQRERDEVFRLAQNLVEENRRLQGSLSQGQQTMAEHAKYAIGQELETAKAKLREAQESFDVDAVVAAQDALMDVKLREDKIKNYRPPAVQEQQNVVQPTQRAPAVDTKAKKWLENNTWFTENAEMKGFAVGLHNKLVADGISPTSDAYYARIDARMREKFPEGFDDGDAAPSVRKQSSVVASASRSTASKKIVLTQTQVSLAKRLGLPLEVYARQVAEEMRK